MPAAILGPVVLVAQSMGGLSAPLAVDRLDVEHLVLLNAMIPAPGETGGGWWAAVVQGEASREAARRDGRPEEFDGRGLLPRRAGRGHERGVLAR